MILTQWDMAFKLCTEKLEYSFASILFATGVEYNYLGHPKFSYF